jgi:lysozyme family protein
MTAESILDIRFLAAFETLLADEGGLVNDPADPGGLTKFGISQRRYPHENIAALTKARARHLYYEDYWRPNGYARIRNGGLAKKLFNLAVNMGATQAHVLVQRALRACGMVLVEDGILGARTLRAIDAVHPDMLLAALRSEAAGFYRTLVALRPKQQRFLKGWLRRAYS